MHKCSLNRNIIKKTIIAIVKKFKSGQSHHIPFHLHVLQFTKLFNNFVATARTDTVILKKQQIAVNAWHITTFSNAKRTLY